MSRNGNPNWNKPFAVAVAPAVQTSFEEMVNHLGLLPADYPRSAELKNWVIANKNSRYVPLDVLKLWGLSVDGDL